VCGGGRYDRLVSEFGRDLPATGFAIGIKRLLIALERQGKLEEIPPVDVLVVAEGSQRGRAYEFMQQLKKQNKRVEMFLSTEESKNPLDYARKKRIPRVVEVREKEDIVEHEIDF